MDSQHSQYSKSTCEEILLQLNESTLHSNKSANDIVVRPQPFIQPHKPLTQRSSFIHIREQLYATFHLTSTTIPKLLQHK